MINSKLFLNLGNPGKQIMNHNNVGSGDGVGGGLRKSLCPILRCQKEQLSSCQPQKKEVDKYH